MDPPINSSGDDSDDKTMADPVELEIASEPRPHRSTMARVDEAQGPLARGTRERPLTPEPVMAAERPRETRGARELDGERDPAEVLRMWPHSSSVPGGRPAVAAVAPPVPAGTLRAEGKIVLAHLALDLYREIEGLQVEVATCNNLGCEARINTLRGALVEACLLVQRAVIMTSAAKDEAKDEVEGRVRELLRLIEP